MFFQECIRSFISETGKEDVLTLRVQDPFHRLLLHGVCEVFPPGLIKKNKLARSWTSKIYTTCSYIHQYIKVHTDQNLKFDRQKYHFGSGTSF